MSEYPQVLLAEDELEEIVAVWEEDVMGFVHDDGEVWGSRADLARWHLVRASMAAAPAR